MRVRMLYACCALPILLEITGSARRAGANGHARISTKKIEEAARHQESTME